MNESIVDLRDPRFGTDKYGFIEELRGRGFCARVANGFVFFNQDDAAHIIKCEDFAFSFFQIDALISTARRIPDCAISLRRRCATG